MSGKEKEFLEKTQQALERIQNDDPEFRAGDLELSDAALKYLL